MAVESPNAITMLGYRSGARGMELTVQAMRDAGLGDYTVDVVYGPKRSVVVTADPDVFALYAEARQGAAKRRIFPKMGGRAFMQELTAAVTREKARRNQPAV